MKISPVYQQFQGKLEDATKSAQPSTHSFADELKAKISEVDNLQHESNAAVMNSAVNGGANIHETMIKMEEAGISRQLLVKVRNKALEAYQEVMRMQV